MAYSETERDPGIIIKSEYNDGRLAKRKRGCVKKIVAYVAYEDTKYFVPTILMSFSKYLYFGNCIA